MSKQTFIVGVDTDKATFDDWIREHDKEVRADAIKECINIIENCVWKDADMLVELIKEKEE